MSGRIFRGLILPFVLFICLPAAARVQTGFLDRKVTISSVTYRYQVYVPADFSPRKKWPVILFLHGKGERGPDGLLQTDVGIGHAIRLNNARFPFIVVLPQCRQANIWGDPDMQIQAVAALEQSIHEFHGDRNRVYLTGLSMGGYGTWDLAAHNPGRFAALVPVCSGVRPLASWPQLRVTKVDSSRYADRYAELARRIGDTPVWIFHGDADQVVPVEESRHMAEALKAEGGNVKYTEYPGVDHNSWDKAYAEPDLVPWLLAQSLKH